MSIYKVAEVADLNFVDYISCIGDLQLIFNRLPSQQYSKILNKFEQNMHSQSITEAIMDKRGDKAHLNTFMRTFSVISENTPELGLHRS